MKLVYLSLLAAGLSVLSACKTSKPHGISLLNKIPARDPNLPYHPSRTLPNDLLHTKLEVSFDWKKQHLLGKATLTLKPYFYPQKQLELDAKGFDIASVKSAGSQQDLSYTYDRKKLIITLDRTYYREELYKIEIKYTAKPNELPAGGNAAINSDKGLFFINPDGSDTLKPRQIWTQGEIESSSCWFPTIDAPNEKMTQELLITVDNGFKTLSNGLLIKSVKNSDGTRTDTWKQEKFHAPYLVMMAVGDFAEIRDVMPKSDQFEWNNMEVNYLVEPAYKTHAKAIFGNTPEMIEFFSKTLQYKFAWDKYAQVVVRDYVSGAMENTSATVHMEALQSTSREILDKNWDNIIAHELFHHWFGDLVTCEEWGQLPLNESFANYSEFLWQEHKYGKDAADAHAQEELQQYLNEALSKQEPLIRYKYKSAEDMFDSHSYAKGGRILHMLRKYVGDEAFFASLSNYLKKKQFGSAEIHDLRMSFEDVTGQDLNWFFNQWFLSSGHADLKVIQSYTNGILSLQINQQQDSSRTPIYKLPLKIGVWAGGKKQTFAVNLSKAKQSFSWPVADSVELVLVDEEAQLLGVIEHQKTMKEWAFQYKNASYFSQRVRALEGLMQSVDHPLTISTLQLALDDPYFELRKMAIEFFDVLRKLANKQAADKMEELAGSDPKGAVRAAAIRFISKETGDHQAIYQKALQDSSYLAQSAGLSAYLQSSANPEDKKITLTRFEKESNSDILKTLAEYYIAEKIPGKNNWFKQHVTAMGGEDLFKMLNIWGDYLPVATEKEKAESIRLLESFARKHPIDWIRYGAFKALSKLPETKSLRKDIKEKEQSERLKEAYKKFD